MKYNSAFAFAAVASFGVACAQGLYFVGDDTSESSPIRWTVGASVVYDDNINPGVVAGNAGFDEDAWSINPYVGAAFTSQSPQTTLDFYARVGVNYYLTESDLEGADDTTANGRIGFDLTHRFSERLRFSSRNFISYEMEPDYAYGVSNQRGVDPYTYWSTDNSLGYRWTERLGSFTGFALTSYAGDSANGDRDSWSVYHQMRYVTSPRSTLTAGYRYSDWGGDASSSQNHYWTVGLEHRLSSTSIVVLNGGIQVRDVDNGDSSTSPYFEVALNTRVNTSFSVRGFARYSVEDLDTIRTIGADTFEFSDQQVLRIGMTGEYALTPRLSGFGGIDYINTSFDAGNEVGGGGLTAGGQAEDLVNLYVGLRAKLSDQLTGECSINYTDSGSDFEGRDYDRLRLSAGVSYSF
jgi:hypothetical protein